MFWDLVDAHFDGERAAITAMLQKLARREAFGTVEAVALDEVLRVPRHSSAWLLLEMQRLGTSRRMVAASLLHKKWMRATLTRWLAAYLLGAQPPSEGLMVAAEAPHGLLWPQQSAAVDPYRFLGDLALRLAHFMVDLHRLAPEIAYGNAALTLALPWSRLADFRHDGDAVVASVRQFFASLGNTALAEALEWTVLGQNGQYAGFARRRSCCLKFRVAGKDYCATCSKVTPDVQHAQLLAKW